MALNASAMEFTPCRAPPGLELVNDLVPPPGLAAPPGLSAPPGLCCPPGLQKLSLADHLDDECTRLAGPPGKFAPPGNFSPANPPGKFTPAAPPGVFVPACPPGKLSVKDSDELSTDVESDAESSLDGSFLD